MSKRLGKSIFNGSILEKSLTLKLSAALILVLSVSFAGLSFSILKRQNSLLGDMSQEIGAALTKTGQESRASFDQIASHVEAFLGQMKETTSQNLSEATAQALSTEEKKIQEALEAMLDKNAESISALLNTVVPNAVIKKNFRELIQYSKAAAQTNEIVFTLFFDAEGGPLPGYLNAKDPKVKEYRKEKGFGTSLQEIVDLAKKDPSVKILEESIKFYDTLLGKTVICMNRDSVEKEIKLLSQRFQDLNQTNTKMIHQEMQNGTDTLKSSLQKDLDHITRENSQALQNTQNILKTSGNTVSNSIRTVIIVVGLICSVLILVLIGILLKVMVVNPIKEVSEGLRDTAQGEGDLTKRLALTRKDEIGVLAGWFDAFLERLNTIISDINTNAQTVTHASQEVLSNAANISQGTRDLSLKSGNVSTATEQMSTNMDSVAAASEQTATNVKQVSDNADQMKTTLNEVVENCMRARTIVDHASEGAQKATDRVTQLGDAAKDISKVTEVITDIAEQTNLLALNATIEAARAGEAGKGFAVVASEIKSLSAQTAEATQDIRAKIQGIQVSTDGTVKEVGVISQVISEVNQIVTTIASAIEQQSAAAAMVAENVGQASAGIDEVNANVAQSSQVSTDIAADIAQVNTIIETMSQEGTDLEQKAEQLSELSAKLKEMISVFKVSTRDNNMG